MTPFLQLTIALRTVKALEVFVYQVFVQVIPFQADIRPGSCAPWLREFLEGDEWTNSLWIRLCYFVSGLHEYILGEELARVQDLEQEQYFLATHHREDGRTVLKIEFDREDARAFFASNNHNGTQG